MTVGSYPQALGLFIGPASAPVLTSIGVSPESKTLNATETQTFTASPKDQDGIDITADVVWSSSNTSVGTIDASGNFTAVAQGTTLVNATNASVVGSASVTVNPAVATNIVACGTISSPGEYMLTTNISNSGASTCIHINSSDVVFDGDGYTINGTDALGTGLGVSNGSTSVTNVTVKNLIVTDEGDGIAYNNATNGSIINNTVISNQCGIYLSLSRSNNISNNNASSNSYGVYIESSSNNNNISNNTANLNSVYGIYLTTSSSNNILTNNTANSNSYAGIFIDNSNSNSLTSNTANSNSNYGIFLTASSSSNTIYNNNFNNTINAQDDGTTNTWNTTKTVGTNVKGGPYLGGNFWAYPNGSGFSQTCTDADGDGICDSSYTLYASNIDYLPLSLNFTYDTTPPASVTSLANISYASNYINWTWSDPMDSDFANVTIYLNGAFMNQSVKRC